MADIGINSVFPSAKFLSTDSRGDIQEIISVDAVPAFVDIDGLTFTAKTGGTGGNNLSVEIIDNVGSGGMAYSSNGNAFTISLEEVADQYSLGGLKSDIASNAPQAFTDTFEVTYTATGTSSNTLTAGGLTATNLANGEDAITPELSPSKKYLVISTDDLADYDGASEETDGRKMFYGLLETATENISNLTDKPENLVINRGSLILLSDSKLRRTYSITATLDILDSDLSAES
jgi:hypothetical protein